MSSSYAKILEKTNFQPREFPWVGQKGRQVEVCTIFLHTEEHDENHLDGFPMSGLKSSEL